MIRLRCIEDSKYEMLYHYHLQGFIYNLLEGSKYDYVHDKEGYKFFCFSNIFPARDLVKNDLRTLIISSPDSEFVCHLNEMLSRQSNAITIGSMKFKIDYVDKLDVRLPGNSPFTLITGTPIIIRIPREKYKAYGIDPKGRYDYVYWRSDHPIDLFISQLENNLRKKYAEYFGFGNDNTAGLNVNGMERPPFLFQKFKFKKQVSTRVPMKGFDQVVIGTVWEFGFEADVNRDMIQFALDVGLGERNSLGFGFMNLK
ncbi:MAG: CRISPR-associated endoribonuclease Cas6 [Thermoplasmatales archaeon]